MWLIAQVSFNSVIIENKVFIEICGAKSHQVGKLVCYVTGTS